MKIPAIDVSQVAPDNTVVSEAIKVTVVITKLSQLSEVVKWISVIPRLEESQEVLKINVVSGIPAVIVVMIKLSHPI